MLPQTEDEGAPVAPAKPRQPCAIQPPSCPPRSSPAEKPKTNIRVWRVRKAKGLKVPFGKGRGSWMQTQGCLSCLHQPTGCAAAGEHMALPSPLAPAQMLFIIEN